MKFLKGAVSPTRYSMSGYHEEQLASIGEQIEARRFHALTDREKVSSGWVTPTDVSDLQPTLAKCRFSDADIMGGVDMLYLCLRTDNRKLDKRLMKAEVQHRLDEEKPAADQRKALKKKIEQDVLDEHLAATTPTTAYTEGLVDLTHGEAYVAGGSDDFVTELRRLGLKVAPRFVSDLFDEIGFEVADATNPKDIRTAFGRWLIDSHINNREMEAEDASVEVGDHVTFVAPDGKQTLSLKGKDAMANDEALRAPMLRLEWGVKSLEILRGSITDQVPATLSLETWSLSRVKIPRVEAKGTAAKLAARLMWVREYYSTIDTLMDDYLRNCPKHWQAWLSKSGTKDMPGFKDASDEPVEAVTNGVKDKDLPF